MNVKHGERPLGGFKTRLEAELVKVVTERGAAQKAQATRATWRRPAVRIGVLAGAVTAALGVLPAVFGGGASPAYGVVHNPDGSVTVTVNDYRHPQQLESKLVATGVPFKVVVGRAGPGCRRLSSTSWPTREQAREIFRDDTAEGHSFVFRPDKVPAGATVFVQIMRSSDGRRFAVITGVTRTSATLRWIGCGPNGAPVS